MQKEKKGCLPKILRSFAIVDKPDKPLEEQFPAEVYSAVADTHRDDLDWPVYSELLCEARRQGYSIIEKNGKLSFSKEIFKK